MPAPQPDPVDERVLHFPDGIPGFPDSTRFTLNDVGEESAFHMLDSVDEPGVSMVVVVPWLFFPDYEPELSDEEQRALRLERPEDAIVFCPVTLDSEAAAVHVNLAGPFVVNATTGEGRQVVLTDPEIPMRAPVHLN